MKRPVKSSRFAFSTIPSFEPPSRQVGEIRSAFYSRSS
jgi:hypothetical protein